MSTPRNAATPRAHLGSRPVNELEFTVTIAPPDGEVGITDGEATPIPVAITVDLRRFTLAERQLAKRAMALMAMPPDWADVILVHAWVVWRRTHPDTRLADWMDNLTFADIIDGLKVEPAGVVWDTTPEDYDPKASPID